MDGNHDNLNEGNYGILTREVNEDDDVDVPMLSMDQPTQYAGKFLVYCKIFRILLCSFGF